MKVALHIKKLIKLIYPLLCITIPFLVYLLVNQKTIVIPLIFMLTMFIGCANLYDNKVVALVTIIALLLFGIGIMSFPFYYTYLLFGWWFLLLPVALLFTYCLILLTKRMILSGHLFKCIILMRKITLFCVVSTVIIIIIPGLYCIIDVQEYSNNRFSFDKNLIGLFGSIGWMLMIGVQILKFAKRVYIFSNYYKPYYILFLRRFIKDDSQQVKDCLDNLSMNSSGYNIMKIGNPQTLFFYSDLYDTVYLNSSNWQKELKKYISCSKLVFLIIDVSDGVIWEMVENSEYLEKYIYCILDGENIDGVKKKLSEHASLNEVLNMQIQRFLSNLQIQQVKQMTLFTFEHGQITYSNNMSSILKYKLKAEWDMNLHIMKL